MNDPVTPAPEAPSRPLSVWRNWITFAGVVVAAGSLFAFLLLLTLDLTGRGAKNPYLGILTYLVAPGFLFLGLILVLGGAWHENRRRVKRPNAPPPQGRDRPVPPPRPADPDLVRGRHARPS